MKLQELISCLPAYAVEDDTNPEITSLQMDSRKVQDGALFFCIRGFTVDGHRFAKQAEASGALAVVSEEPLDLSVPVIVVRDSKRAMALIAARFYDFPSTKMRLTGVTGTNGKTTVTHLLQEIYMEAGFPAGLIGTMYTKYGNEVKPSVNTTPESLVLQEMFFDMHDQGMEHVVMEVSSHALQLGRTHGTDFDIAVFTNLSQDHLDYHETMDEYAAAKALLFSQLGSGYHPQKQKFAVINGDDPYAEKMITAAAAPVITYAIDSQADIRAENVNVHAGGSAFDLVHYNRHFRIELQMPGRFSVYNALAAAAAAYAGGIGWETICKVLPEVKSVSGRFEKIASSSPVNVIVDYAHTSDSLENVLQTISEFANGNVRTVVGCGGDRDKTKRPLMASTAEKWSDYVYLTSDNPRSENPRTILEEMEQGLSTSAYELIEDREKAIRQAVNDSGPDDVILIAGKGHETYQIIGEQTYDFDDRLVAKQALEELGMK
ncbi:UDP-N-acetylmuramoyl-L-alanyl-D-glutamate--2,6-diaminopimelate ligase [Salisediminibacterium halotolerans]|uniref:UDP-N-acetylmuramoyl-L-alanyl-D-glutamate--2, 6-diaminopimelate ligase n=1 Tax=Salisediminibacterium halotolerans TaxID=517425 RepID=UPI000EB219EF|nr:UDP-N-acetylmuramoyl-L-alanyl-D-glutamate--2,6-diaminopimelate ligase [Salisediminibacterium halotolerans]RLJ74310.1 UDP-N-acetylmuramoylalanyl-D-glutamate--2,6-diaminopimelate ligase [Actinophytocola xinjiangensis]RPE87597.1 UDP-N-acetylmuramoylalanyl-D-glutamate--2,6-diaminopimelate ligase [Salisediminibacterium halotolerans]TWG35147.1 UDP-N-acetylmuramoylalanyl-D-glutamate--2,6-diaminopimelate ligase [Salisediminibacterium halotolerans]GEL07294.1 UDP-N-acetylmuramoyl-L-alanyl-D-glutamate-